MEDCKRIELYYLEQLWEVTATLSQRPRLAATASVYFRKFYVEYCFVDAEPSLVAGTALNLAGKIEECPIRIETLLTCAISPPILVISISADPNTNFFF